MKNFTSGLIVSTILMVGQGDLTSRNCVLYSGHASAWTAWRPVAVMGEKGRGLLLAHTISLTVVCGLPLCWQVVKRQRVIFLQVPSEGCVSTTRTWTLRIQWRMPQWRSQPTGRRQVQPLERPRNPKTNAALATRPGTGAFCFVVKSWGSKRTTRFGVTVREMVSPTPAMRLL